MKKWTQLLIFDIVRFSNEIVTKRECLLMQVRKTKTWIHGKYIQYYSIPFPSKYSLFHRVPWRWRYCKSKQCSNDHFPTFAKPSEVKENTNEQFHSLSQLQYTYPFILYVDVGPQPHQQLGHCDMAIRRCPVQRRPTILIQSNNKYKYKFTFRLEITLPTILISTNYTFTLSSNLQLQITNTINHYIANYKSRIENTTQAIAKVTAMRSSSMKTNKTLSKENIKLHEFVAMKSLIYIFSNI